MWNLGGLNRARVDSEPRINDILCDLFRSKISFVICVDVRGELHKDTKRDVDREVGTMYIKPATKRRIDSRNFPSQLNVDRCRGSSFESCCGLRRCLTSIVDASVAYSPVSVFDYVRL